MKRALIALCVLAAVAVMWAIYITRAPETPAGQPPLGRIDHSGLGSLRERFNASAQPKVLVLLSPT